MTTAGRHETLPSARPHGATRIWQAARTGVWRAGQTRAVDERDASVCLFEENPWLLLPIIILTVEAWAALKAVIRAAMARRERLKAD